MSTTQLRNHHWKMVNNSKNEGGSSLSVSGNKRKFTPLKDNSMQDSKIFQKSRQRSNSSFVTLNKSRDIETVTHKQKKIVSKLTQGKTNNPQPSTIVSVIRPSQLKSLEPKQQAKMNFSALTELQKQFKLFKQKVMKLLQRHQEQIHHLAKQILQACKVEITKFQQNNALKICPNCKMHQKSQQFSINQQDLLKKSLEENQRVKSPKVKQIEDIKSQLDAKIRKINSPFKNSTKPEQIKEPKPIPKINFQEIYSKFSHTFDILKKLNQNKLQSQEITGSLSVLQCSVQSPRKTKVFSRKPTTSK